MSILSDVSKLFGFGDKAKKAKAERSTEYRLRTPNGGFMTVSFRQSASLETFRRYHGMPVIGHVDDERLRRALTWDLMRCEGLPGLSAYVDILELVDVSYSEEVTRRMNALDERKGRVTDEDLLQAVREAIGDDVLRIHGNHTLHHFTSTRLIAALVQRCGRQVSPYRHGEDGIGWMVGGFEPQVSHACRFAFGHDTLFGQGARLHYLAEVEAGRALSEPTFDLDQFSIQNLRHVRSAEAA
jgi:hypothetical protein